MRLPSETNRAVCHASPLHDLRVPSMEKTHLVFEDGLAIASDCAFARIVRSESGCGWLHRPGRFSFPGFLLPFFAPFRFSSPPSSLRAIICSPFLSLAFPGCLLSSRSTARQFSPCFCRGCKSSGLTLTREAPMSPSEPAKQGCCQQLASTRTNIKDALTSRHYYGLPI